ncbi:MAG: type II secretion system F family protein [Peptoanaerobacter stomatis]|uniref:type II secretion system F family protein n=1 Tax=Peptoanaerobacter stomatis TaxID=796937 RepID=UPI003FA10B21
MKSNLLTNSELSLFCYQLSLIFKSGIPLDEAMSVFTDEMSTPVLKKIAQDIKESVGMGEGLHDAIKKHEEFPKYMVGMIEIAYNTGNLEGELERLSNYYQELERLNQKVSNAVTYPIILTGLMFIVIGFLVIKVIPMFNNILQSIGGSMPQATNMLINVGMILRNYGLIIVAILVILGFALYFYTKSKSDAWKYNTPFIGEINKKIFSEKFALGMSMLMKGGYSFDDALEVYIRSVESVYATSVLKKAQKNILEGEDVAQEISKVNLFPTLFTKMLTIGYKTGELESSLTKVSSVYKLEVEKTMDKVTSSIEPALVIILSLVVGVILFTVMTPLISIISSL